MGARRPDTHPPGQMAPGQMIQALVVFALPQRAYTFAVRVAPGTRVGAAIASSGLFEQLPRLKDQPLEVGIFGRPCTLQDPVRPGDRIEIYRPLQEDPKAARRQRAAAQRH